MILQLFSKNGEFVATVRVGCSAPPDIVMLPDGRKFFLEGGRYVQATVIAMGDLNWQE